MTIIPDINGSISSIQIKTERGFTLNIDGRGAFWTADKPETRIPKALQNIFIGRDGMKNAIITYNETFPRRK